MRHLAGVAAAALVFAIAAPAFAQPFADVPTNHWAYDAIAELAAKGLIEGYPDGTFKGDRAMTRYEMAMVVARLLARIESIQIPTPPPPPRPEVTRADIQAIQRLVNEFRAELAALGVRVTAIEEELNAIKAKLDNVRLTGAFRFSYDVFRTAGPNGLAGFSFATPLAFLPGTVNGNPTTTSTDSSKAAALPRVINLVKLVADGSVAPDVHLIVALMNGGRGNTFGPLPMSGAFSSACFGAGTATCPGTTGQNTLGTVDNLFFDWKNAFGWPLEFWLGRFGGSGIAYGSHPVQFGPFGLLMNTSGDTWEDSTNSSGANVVDGLYMTSHVASLADLQVQALIARVTGGIGSTTYAWGEDAYGIDANVRVFPGLRLGGYYVANSITNPAGIPTVLFAPQAANGPLWHAYGFGGGAMNPTTAHCPIDANSTMALAAIQCPALGSGGGGYVQWDVVPGIHLDGEYAQWNDGVNQTSDTGYQANITWDLGTLTGIGHNLILQTGYLSYGVNFYPPYGAAEADVTMADVFYPGNENGFTAQIRFDPIANWTVYGMFYGGTNISNGQSQTEYEAGATYRFAASSQITFKVRDLRINNVEQFLLYRAQLDYTF